MANIVFDKDKHFQNKNAKPVQTLPSVVTVCLAPCDICTQEYIDVTHSFRMRCCCRCHDNEVDRKEVSQQKWDGAAR